MRKTISLALAVGAAVLLCACGSSDSGSTTAAADNAGAAEEGGIYTPGTYSGEAEGFGGSVIVTITTDADSITAVTVVGDDETPTVGGAHLEELADAIMEAQSADIDTISGATFTSNGAIEAAKQAIEMAQGKGEAKADGGPLTFKAGTYTGKGDGYNGEVLLDVTFSDDAITDIAINTEGETAHVGTVAYDIIFADAINANGSGVDSVSGATFTSRAIKAALNDAAEQADVSDLSTFQNNTVVHEAQDPIDVTYDIVVVGAGGAGMATAAQATQNGDSVLVIEKNAEIGGNTTVSGGQYQSVMPYLVWDPDDPDATTGVYEYDGQSYDKVMSVQGCIDTLKTILNWSEEPFDEDYYKDHEYVAGNIDDISQHGVHAEYLPTLQALKEEIQAYLDWAQPKLDAGTPEDEITLFSTLNLHIFQTYYGGLRQNAEKDEWIYGDYDLVSQFINEAQGLKEWLEDMDAVFDDGSQLTLIGALWYRENAYTGCDLDHDGQIDEGGVYGSYFMPMRNVVESAGNNEIMLRTTADSLIEEDGRITGVNATMYDGTPVTAHASKGVVLATGGFAANIEKVMETNDYWDPSYITSTTKTTNRSSMQGDGLVMAGDVGAATTGEAFTQMMPISWVDNGNLAFGSGTWAVYINPTTGDRFVDESAERDVLSLGEFQNGIESQGAQGVFLEISNADVMVGRPYPYDDYDNNVSGKDELDGRVYFVSSEEELQELLDKYDMEASAADVYSTIEAYDQAIMANEQPDVAKGQASDLIGKADKDASGNYDPSTYELDGVLIRVRILAPSTHHTMGGLVVDTDRHVLGESGDAIEGLYAAGEVTGGIHGGNRLGGNAIVEILVSGRIAADSIDADN